MLNFSVEFNENSADFEMQFDNQSQNFDVDVAENIVVTGSGEGGYVDLSNYYTKSQTNAAIAEAIEEIELLPGPAGADGKDGANGKDGYSPVRGVDYWTEADKEEIVTEVVSEVPSADLTGYATEEYVGKKIAEAQLGGSGVDLSAYYTKTETDSAIKTAVDAVELLPGPQGEAGADGEDGVSATHSWNGTVLTITSASGTSSADLKGADGKDGSDGAPGKDGADGFSPTASVASVDGGATITITDAKGTTSVTVTNGKDGERGPAGEDGYTPQKNVDYWTDADKTEIVNAVLAALPVYGGEVG